MKIAFLLILFSINSFGQAKWIDSLKINFDIQPISTLINEFNFLELHDINELESHHRWMYYIDKSIVHLYLDKDSVIYYLEMAIENNEKALCRLFEKAEWYYFKRIEEGVVTKNKKFYFHEIPKKEQILLRKICSKYDFSYVDNRKKSNVEKIIMKNDQRERLKREIKWNEQNYYDEKNRLFLDSIYTAYGSFAPFNRYEQDAFSFVLHHSNDCEWNKKWFKIWLDELVKGNVKGGKLLGQAIIRMLEPNKGVCSLRDPEDIKGFVKYLKKHYPIKYAEELGYINY